MYKLFALFAIIIIVTGVVVLAVPKSDPVATTRSLTPEEMTVPSVLVWVRDIAEDVQAPLSILFGIVSLYWNRKNYVRQRERG